MRGCRQGITSPSGRLVAGWEGESGVFGTSYQIARIWGIPVKVHISLVLLLLYVGLHGGFAVGSQYGWARGGLAVFVNVFLMMLVFASVALHELGHSFIALRKGCRVRQITLMIMGGAAQMERIPRRPRDECLMAAAGPTVSLLLGSLSMAGGHWLRNGGFVLSGSFFITLGIVNLLLAAFNLLPAFPMDGGRILRAALSGRMGRLQATYTAAQIGKFLAVFMGLFGLLNGNWFLVAIAFFIYTAAGAEYRMLQLQEAFRPSSRFFGNGVEDDVFAWSAHGVAPDGSGDEIEDEDEDEVIVSPPPYRKGPAQRVDIHRENGVRRKLFFG